MAVALVTVRLRSGVMIIRRDRDEIHDAVPNPSLGLDTVGEGPHRRRTSLEDHGFQTGVMIKVHVGRRYHQLMMLVPNLDQPLG